MTAQRITTKPARVFQRGAPTEPDLDKLRELWPGAKMQEGQVITYSDIEAAIFYDRSSHRFGTVLARWRKLLMEEQRIVLVPVPTVGFKVASDSEKVAVTHGHLRKSVRSAQRSFIIGNMVNASKLTPDEKQRHQVAVQKSGFWCAYNNLRPRAKLPELG